MPLQSRYPSVVVPTVDLWSLLFDRTDKLFPEDQVLHVDIYTGRSVTFQDLRQSSECFGRGLKKHWDWQKGDRLALFTPNCIDILTVSFGALWAGGVVSPFNSTLQIGELVKLLRASRPAALATHSQCLQVVSEAATIVGLPRERIILLDRVSDHSSFSHYETLKSGDLEQKKADVNPEDDLSYLVYSSGTTGRPKGVMLTHRNVVANVLQNNHSDAHLVNWDLDRIVGFLPMFHIYGIAVLMLLPIYRGTTVYLMARFDLETICETIEKKKITLSYLVPPVALALAKHPLVNKYNLSSLRMLHSSAAPLAVNLVQGIYKRLGVPVKQGYGISEAAPGIASQEWEHWNDPVGSSGFLVPSMSVKIMANGAEVGPSKHGEIWLRGPNIFKGYFDNPTATAEVLDGDGWYHTGDIGFIDQTGNIFVTDRVKELIKYNGFQVAPAELESLLLGHPVVADVAVIGVYDENRATELPRAYVVIAKAFEQTSKLDAELQNWTKDRVAGYKQLRGGVRFVSEIPKSPAGKVLRRILVDQAKNEALTPKARI